MSNKGVTMEVDTSDLATDHNLDSRIAEVPPSATSKTAPNEASPTPIQNEATAEPPSDSQTASTDREAWDHSDRRVLLQGVHKFHDVKKTRKMAQEWIDEINTQQSSPLVLVKIKKPPKKTWASLSFETPDMVQPFIDYVNNKNVPGNKSGRALFAKRAAANDTVRDKRRRESDDEGEDGRGAKRQSRKELEQQSRRAATEEEVKDRVCPLWRLTPEEQATQKLKEMIKKSALKIMTEVKAKFRVLEKEKREKIPWYDWMKGKRSIEVKDIITVPTPIRNKVEFTFGYRYLTDETVKEAQSASEAKKTEPPKVPAVGFMVLGWAGGVSRPHGCPNIGSEFCAVCDLFDDFLKDSPLPPYDASAHTGFWRFLTIRASRRTRQCMLVIVHSPTSGGQGEQVDWSATVDQERERLLAMLQKAKLPVPNQEPIEITSVYFQEYEGLSNPKPDDPVTLAYGKPTIEEQLGKCIFHISPGAFFQVNTPGAEILFAKVVEKVKEVSEDPQNTLLFDVCCGTGTIGLTCMKEGVVGKVVGIDISQAAIRDAKKNAEANGYVSTGNAATTRFVASRAEHVMQKEIAKASHGSQMKFVAVVDPAREGLHADVIRALRATEGIDRIVYVSCNPTGSLINDAGLLCTPPTKKYKGMPFEVESAQPVDMFPLTSHCEMIMVFDRVGTVRREQGVSRDEPTKNEVLDKVEKEEAAEPN